MQPVKSDIKYGLELTNEAEGWDNFSVCELYADFILVRRVAHCINIPCRCPQSPQQAPNNLFFSSSSHAFLRQPHYWSNILWKLISFPVLISSNFSTSYQNEQNFSAILCFTGKWLRLCYLAWQSSCTVCKWKTDDVTSFHFLGYLSSILFKH